MSEKIKVYTIELHHPDYGKQLIHVDHEASIGSARNNTAYFDEFELEAKHCVFRSHRGVLTLFQIAEGGTTRIGRQELESGRMYILEEGDKVTMGTLKSYVRAKEEDFVEEEEEEQEEATEQTPLPNFDDNSDDIEDEDEQERGPSLFARLFSFFKRKKKIAEDEEEQEEITILKSLPKSAPKHKEDDTAEIIIKKPLSEVRFSDPPGFVARLFALICELVIAYGIVSNFALIFENEDLAEQLYTDLLPFVQKGIAIAAPYLGEYASYLNVFTSFFVISVFAVWFTLNLLSNILRSANFGLGMMGVRTMGNPLTARIKAVIRFIISLVTTPVLIFDLPALVKKRTLKEILTGSNLQSPSNTGKIFGAIFVLPLIVIIALSLPILLEPDLMEGPEIVRQLDKEIAEMPEGARSYHWRHLGLTLNYNPEKANEWIYSPLLNQQGNKFQAILHFARQKEDEGYELITLGPLHESEIAQKQINWLTKVDPFYDSKYANLAISIENQIPSPAADRDRMTLFSDALELSWETLPRFLMERGPVLGPYIELKKALLTELSITSSNVITLSKFGHIPMLEVSGPSPSINFFTIVDQKLTSFQLSASNSGHTLLQKFRNAFLSNIAPINQNVAAPYNREEQWSPFDFIDHFSKEPYPELEKGSRGLSNFMGAVLGQRLSHKWSRELILGDYKRMMLKLDELRQNDTSEAIKQAYKAINIDQTLWSDGKLAPRKDK